MQKIDAALLVYFTKTSNKLQIFELNTPFPFAQRAHPAMRAPFVDPSVVPFLGAGLGRFDTPMTLVILNSHRQAGRWLRKIEG